MSENIEAALLIPNDFTAATKGTNVKESYVTCERHRVSSLQLKFPQQLQKETPTFISKFYLTKRSDYQTFTLIGQSLKKTNQLKK